MLNSDISLAPKLPNIGTSIFSIMSQLANEHDAINLSQGFPSFSSDAKLLSLVNQYMKKGFNQYAPMQGILPLRESLAEKMASLYAVNYHPEDEITITAGATQAIYAAITAVVREGDEVIIFEPAYDCYVPAIQLNGGIPVAIELKYPDYKIDWEQVKNSINRNTKMIIINTPHNPTGSVLNKEDMQVLERLTKETDILILSDEVYEHIIFDGLPHESVAKYPNLANRSFVIYSFGKTFHNTGWKMGYCLAPKNLMKEFRSVHQFIVFSVNTPIQYALAEYMKDPNTYLGLNEFYEKKRNFFLNAISDSRFEALPAKGTYFQSLSYKNITDEKDLDFAKRLTIEHKVASIPLSPFYKNKTDNKVLRFCFAKDEKTLEKAAKKLCKI